VPRSKARACFRFGVRRRSGRRGADAHGKVEAFFDEVDKTLRELDVEAHLRMPASEGSDRRCQVARA
jgi:hypothetical protein